jgi:phosphoribosylformimino-5-aminoimidazole carboxamide ribotide isomerase
VATFDILPAIDLRGGRCVRLHQGDFDAETVYDDDPVRVARGFEAAGARWIHVVDLDAARTGVHAHLAQISAVAAAVSCRVEVGGGVRDAEAARRLLDAGVARVVVGTAAVERPDLVAELCRDHPGQVAVGLDARGDAVAVRGWEHSAGSGGGTGLLERARAFEGVGVAALVVTEIARDGTMEGPDLEQLGSVLAATSVPVVASGGVGTIDDIGAVHGLERSGRRLAGVIAGRAIYEGRLDLAEALARYDGAR